MTTAEIKELIQLANESGVAELEVQRGEDRVRIRRAPFLAEMASSGNTVAGAMPSHVAPAPQLMVTPRLPEAPEEASLFVIKSPIVGTFYDAPSPGSSAFVKVGDTISPGQVLCIIESMKLMNEIEAETGGVIVSKLVESGRAVEYGESLFTIRPA